MSTTPYYGEPWRVVSLADGGIASSDGSSIVDKLSKSHRAIACVNACAGMTDPAAEIGAMREAIREAHDAFILGESPLPKLRPFLKPFIKP